MMTYHKFLPLLLSVGIATASGWTNPVAAQRVVDVTPSVNSVNVSPEASISGVFENTDNDIIQSGSVRLYLNGQDITARSTITRNFFSYRPERPLPPGNYTVRVDYESNQGQLRSVSWRFTVRSQTNLMVSRVAHNATQALGPGTTLLVTAYGTPGADASILLVEEGRTVRTIQAQESSPGVYTTTLPVAGNLREGIVVARFEKQGQVAYGVANQAAIFNSQAQSTAAPATAGGTSSTYNPPGNIELMAPQITSHRNGDRIATRGFTLVGQTTPNSRVNAIVTATTPLLGGVISLGGDRLVNQTFQADSQGRFEINVPSPALVQRGTRYGIELTATLGEQTSRATTLTLRQR